MQVSASPGGTAVQKCVRVEVLSSLTSPIVVPIQSDIYIKSSISSPQHRTHKARTSKHPHASCNTAPGAVKPSQTNTERQTAKSVQDVASGRAILSEKVRRSAPQYERTKRKERSGGTGSVQLVARHACSAHRSVGWSPSQRICLDAHIWRVGPPVRQSNAYDLCTPVAMFPSLSEPKRHCLPVACSAIRQYFAASRLMQQQSPTEEQWCEMFRIHVSLNLPQSSTEERCQRSIVVEHNDMGHEAIALALHQKVNEKEMHTHCT